MNTLRTSAKVTGRTRTETQDTGAKEEQTTLGHV